MYYLIETSYVGPNTRDSSGAIIGDSRVMSICTEPGKTNQSHEDCVDGWLGTTNDNNANACGEYETIEEARASAHAAGFTREYEDEDVVEAWISEAAARDQWDAGDWFESYTPGITVGMTDDDVEALAAKLDDEAREDNAEVHGTLEYLTEIRDELVAAN